MNQLVDGEEVPGWVREDGRGTRRHSFNLARVPRPLTDRNHFGHTTQCSAEEELSSWTSNLSNGIRLGLEDNKAVVGRHFQLISKGDAKGAAALFAPRATNHGREVSREGILRTMEALIGQEQHFTIHEFVAEADWVACRTIVSGRNNSRPVLLDHGIHSLAEPKGQAYTFQHVHLFKVANGQIVEQWANRDDLGAAGQLGLELKPAEKEPVG